MNEEICNVCKGTGMRESWNSFTGEKYPFKVRCWCKNIPNFNALDEDYSDDLFVTSSGYRYNQYYH